MHRLALDRVEAGVQRPDRGIDAELRLPPAHEHVAEDGEAVAAGQSRLLQGRPLPLRGHFVKRHIQPPRVMVGQVLGQAIQGRADGPLVAIADHAAVRLLDLGCVRREHDRAADAQPRPGQRAAAAPPRWTR